MAQLPDKKNQHATRVLTGITLLIAVTSAIAFLYTVYPYEYHYYLSGIALLVALLAGFEYGKLLKDSLIKALIYPAIVLVICFPFSPMISILFAIEPLDSKNWLIGATCWWGLVLILLTTFNYSFYQRPWLPYFLNIHAILSLVAFWLAMHQIASVLHPIWVVYLIILIAVCDTSAYYSGKRYGKRLLCPEVSAGKTREGLWGSLVGALLFSLSFFWFAMSSDLIYFILLSLLVCLISIVGDFSASIAKRYAGAKDSGTLLPGHGGVLDRVDALVASAPFFWLGLLFSH